MSHLSERFAELGTKLRNNILRDVFASARMRITLLYFLMGVIIFAAAGVATYERTIGILNFLTGNVSWKAAGPSRLNRSRMSRGAG